MEFSGGFIYDDRKLAAVVYDEERTMPAFAPESALQARPRRRSNTYDSNMDGSNSSMIDESSIVVERILSAIELRGDNGLRPHGGPLTNVEIVRLSTLCAKQTEHINRNKGKKIDNHTNDTINDGAILNENLGFSDVDADMMAQLVEHLEKHVVLASQINLVQSSYDAILNLKKADGIREVGCRTIDEWIRKGTGSELVGTLSNGLEAAMVLLSIMTSPGIDRRVVKEDAVAASLVLMKHNLMKNILPAVNNCGHILASMSKSQLHASLTPTKKRRRRSSASASSSIDASIIKDMGKCYKSMIFKTVSNTVLLMERLDALIQKVALDDQHLMTLSAGALVSLEIDPSTDAAIRFTHSLHVATVGIVTSIFRSYRKLRPMIIEDLFALMLKMPSGKKGMRTYTIQYSSALYPQAALELSKSLLMGATGGGGDTPVHSDKASNIQPICVMIMSLVQSTVIQPSFVDSRQINTGNHACLRDCQAISDFFVSHLLKRCSKKGEDGGASEFRPILSNLIEDLLLVLLVPEYPAAEMILLSIANFMYHDIIQMTSTKVGKESTTTTYFNTIFDALGKISAAVARINKWNKEHPVRLELPRIRENGTMKHLGCYCNETEFTGDKFMVKCDRCNTWYHGDCIGISRETVPEKWLCDGCQFGRIVEFERDRNSNLGELGCPPNLIDRPYCLRRLVIDYLSVLSRNSDLKGVTDAYGFQLARWLKEVETTNAKRKEGDIDDTLPLIAGLIELWDPRNSMGTFQGNDAGSLSGMLNCMSDEGRSRMVVDFICKLSSLLTSFKSQVGRIVKLLESPSNSVRKLSLKAIEKIADADPTLMTHPFVRNAVARRFSDESISVRDAVVSLVGSYVLNTPEVANAFHPALIHGLSDSGLSVRKRTIHVLRDILCTNPTYNGRAEACSVMLRLAADPKEDDTVRDLIYDLFSKIWLEQGDKTFDSRSNSSYSIQNLDKLVSPVSRVSNVEDITLKSTPSQPPSGIKTPSGASVTPYTPNGWTSVTKSTRSTVKKCRSRYLQLRCQAAAEQMVEVVKAANTERDLTLLFRELLSATPDSNKSRKSSARRKRCGLAQNHMSLLVDALFEMILSVEEDYSKSVGEKGGELVSIFRTLRVFTDASPTDVLRHLDTLLPYLKIDNGLKSADEANIACSLCGVLSRVVPELDHGDCERLGDSSLADDLVAITKKWGKAASSSAVQALCLFSGKERKGIFEKRLVSLAKLFHSYLVKIERSGDFATKRKTKNHVSRALSVLGSICRYCETSSFDLTESEMDEDHDENEIDVQEVTLLRIAPLCQELFMKFYAKDDVTIKVCAIQALTGIFMAHPREMLKLECSGLLTEVMASTSPEAVQRESLRCWRDILLAEESRVESGEAKAKMDSKKNITVSKKISGDQDADATIFGGILTNHSSRLFEMTKCREKDIRFAAVDLIGHLLRQGQLNPNEATPHLLALQGDVEEIIRRSALKFLMLEGEKRPDMLRQRLCAGVKQAYLFQIAVNPDLKEVSALIDVRKDGNLHKECVFGSVYKNCIASIKKQRRGLFRNLLSSFDPQNLNSTEGQQTNSSISRLMLLSYTSQVLAYLPYSVASDALYIIYYISSNIALQGADLLDKFASFLRLYSLASDDEFDEVNSEADQLEEAVNNHSPYPANHIAAFLEGKLSLDISKFSDLCSEAGCLILLLRLKNFLRVTYNLSESRCIGFNPDKKEIGEKPILKSSTASIFDSKLPIFRQYKSTAKEKMNDNGILNACILQYAEFRRLMRSEVNNASLNDDESDVENEGLSEDGKVSLKRPRSDSEGEQTVE